MIFALISAFITLLTIGFGMFSMAKDDEYRTKYANKIMQARVFFQALSIFFLILAFTTGGD
jgi:hypothetical protein